MNRALLATLLIAAGPGAVNAQPELARLTTDPHLQTRMAPVASRGDPLLDPVTKLVELPVAPADEHIRISTDIGLPLGVRVQARLYESRFWAEFGAGVWWIAPYVSTALRYDLHMYEGQRNTIALRPSISATYIPLTRSGFGAGTDCEVIWQHRFHSNLATDLGFRLGLSAFYAGKSWWPVPIATFVFAVQF